MRGRDYAHPGRERPEVARAPPVDAHAFFDDALAYQVLGVRADGGGDLPFPPGHLGRHLLEQRPRHLGQGGFALGFERNGRHLAQALRTQGFDPGVDVGAVVLPGLVGQRRPRPGLGPELELQVDRLLDPALGRLQALGDHFFGHLGGPAGVIGPRPFGPTGFDHHHGHVPVRQGPTGHDQLEGRVVAFLVRRMGQPFAGLRIGDPDRPDRALEGEARDHERGAGRVYGQHVMGVGLVGAQDGDDHLGLVAVTVGERGPQGPVDKPGREYGALGGPALTAEKRAGYLAGRVHPLFDVDGQREEIDALGGVCGGVGRGQNDGVAYAGDNGSLGLLGQ